MRGDCLELMREIPDGSVDLVLTDPPYNVGVRETRDGRTETAAWDKIDGYIDWSVSWLLECQRVLRPTGVLYFFHNDMDQIAELLHAIRRRTRLALISFCVWDKGDTFRARSWADRDPEGDTAPRSWFSVCEYCLHFFNAAGDGERMWAKTGLERINSNPACYRPLKDWYAAERRRLGLATKDIARRYTQVTGKGDGMLRHYFQNSQFEIPTRAVFETVYEPLGFVYVGADGGQGYEALRQDYEALRNYHRCDKNHCNIWHIPPIPSNNRLHTCQKPVPLLERLVRVSCPEGGTVLDPFMGSGSTGVACVNTGREFIGIERDERYFQIARDRIEEADGQVRLGEFIG